MKPIKRTGHRREASRRSNPVTSDGAEAGGTRSPARRRKARLLIRGAVSVVVVGVLLVVGGHFYAPDTVPVALGYKPPPWVPPDPLDCFPSVQPGAPRRWEASIQISTYSVANLLNRNVLTTIPLFG